MAAFVLGIAIFSAILLIFSMAVWMVASAFRILYPERRLPFAADPVHQRQQARAAGRPVPVDFAAISADQRHTDRTSAPTWYAYADGHSDGWPADWEADLYYRRN